MKREILEQLLELSFCWEKHKVPYKTKLSTIYVILTGYSFPGDIEKEIKLIIKDLLIKKGFSSNCRKFNMPEQISWCGCEPKNSLRRMSLKMLHSLSILK
jgi:hypothetical protein